MLSIFWCMVFRRQTNTFIGNFYLKLYLKHINMLSLFSCCVQLFAPHGLQHTRPPCPSPSPGVCPSSCPLSQWCYPAFSSPAALFSFCPQPFPASGKPAIKLMKTFLFGLSSQFMLFILIGLQTRARRGTKEETGKWP